MMQAGTPSQGARIEQAIGRIDRRIVYLGLLVFTLLPLVFRWSLKLYPTDPPAKLKAAIDGLPADRLVFITSNWDAGTQAENRPQLVAVVRHLIRRKLKFALLAIANPNAPQLADTEVRRAIELEHAGAAYPYGEGWVNLGYKVANEPWFRSFAQDISDAAKEDFHSTPVSQIPVMKGVHKFGPDGQVSMVIDITGSDTISSWYQYLGPSKVLIGLGCTAVMAPEQYPYLDSNQLSGLLTGMKGAAEYEQLIDAPGSGLPAMAGQSFAHLYIFLLILLGNLSLLLGWLERRRRR
jgi:hypothetical protein